MKILLINPEKLIQPPFGLLYIGSVLKDKGHEVKIFEIPFDVERDEYIRLVRDQMQEFSPRIIGITCMSMQTGIVRDLTRYIRERSRDTLLIVGGVHPTIDRHDPLLWGADISVQGEAEDTILDIVDFAEGRRRIESIEGISYQGKDGIVDNPRREQIRDLNKIPVLSYELLGRKRLRKRNYAIRGLWLRCGSVMTTRGCPAKCIFCGSKTMHDRVVREFSVDRIADEIGRLKKDYGIEGFCVVDDTFTLKENRVIEFCRKLKERKLNLPWVCQARVDTFTEPMARAMKSSGCVQVDFGVESGSQKVLDILKKGITVSDTKKAFGICKDNKLRSLATIMIGAPGETKEDIKLTRELLSEINPSFLGCFFATPFPGTELYEMALANKWIDITKPIRWQTMERPLMTINMTEGELKKEFEDMQRYNKDSVLMYLANPVFILDLAGMFFKNSRKFMKIVYSLLSGRKGDAINTFLFLFRKEFLN